jgi:peptidoglycan/LPS O-acetylase OafA/YrhL
VLAVVNLPDPETALTLWAAGFGLLTAASLLAYQVVEHFRQEERKRRRLALAESYEREIARSTRDRTLAA